MRVGGAISQLDLPSLTLLSVAGCGRLLLGVPIGLLQHITVIVGSIIDWINYRLTVIIDYWV